MKKRLLPILSLLCLILCLSVLFSACDKDQDTTKGTEHELDRPNNTNDSLPPNGNQNSQPNQTTGTDGLIYSINKDMRSYTLCHIGSAKEKNIVIPSEYNGLPVTGIAGDAFAGYAIESVIIPDSINDIETGAFENCDALTYTVYENANYLGNPNNPHLYLANIIEKTAQSVTISETTKVIGNNAFADCMNLTSILIPSHVTSIGASAFNGCVSLSAVHTQDLTAWCRINFKNESANPLLHAKKLYVENNLIENLVIPGDVTEIGNYTFANCTEISDIDFPDGLTSIGNYAFKNCAALKTLTLSGSITTIGIGTFIDCFSLEAITIGNNLTSIGNRAFVNCIALTTITIGNSVASIGESAFNACTALNTVHVSDLAAWCEITFIDRISNPLRYAKNLYLNGKQITDLAIPEGVKSIKNYTFYYCAALTSVTIPDSVTSIGNSAFSNCWALETIAIGKGVKSIGDSAFFGCSLLNAVHITDLAAWCQINFSYSGYKEYVSNPLHYAHKLYLDGSLLTDLVIPESVERISDYAFWECSTIKTLTIPNGIHSIGFYTFNGCAGLESVTLGKDLCDIGTYAFNNCESLNAVHISNLASWCKIDFKDATSNPLYYAKNLYLNDHLITDLIIPDGITAIESYTFISCANLASITLPNSVKSIGTCAFSNCPALVEVQIGSGVTSIKDNAFVNCNALSLITVSEQNKHYRMSGNCLVEIESKTLLLGFDDSIIPSDGRVTSIANNAFYNRDKLSTIDIPESITTIGAQAFYGCRALKTVTMGDRVTSIGSMAFNYCKEACILLPVSVKTVGASAFGSPWAGEVNCVYYAGTPLEWSLISYPEYDDTGINYITRYYYSESPPTDTAYQYWHYVDGIPTVW